ncbi:MAG: RNA methyltransferase [Solirubrobacterales bacterium]|nr:RNA methyltransferase [Solirubrobacterales bacterium]
MITSKDNEKLKLVRKLGMKKHREKLGLFVTEGEDLARAGLAAGHEPRALLVHPECEIEGEMVEPDLLDGVSSLASGTKVIGIWPETWAEPDAVDGQTCLYLDGVSDPGNVGTIIRTADALIGGVVVIGPGSADPFSAGAVRASMGSIFTQTILRAGIEATPAPRIATVPSGGETPGPIAGSATICLGSEREGLSAAVLKECEARWTIPQRPGGAQSLNVAAAAAIACERVSSPPEEPATESLDSGT